jgi:hypothetical protein
MHRLLSIALIFVFVARPVVAADFATEMMEATFKLGEGNAGTCFLVRREAPDAALYLVTVGHAFDDNDDKTAKVVLRTRNPDGSYERREHTVSLRRDGKPLWARHKKQDVAVLRIAEPLPVQVPALPVSALADDAKLKASGARLCGPLFVLGYPMELEADAAAFRWLDTGSLRVRHCCLWHPIQVSSPTTKR